MFAFLKKFLNFKLDKDSYFKIFSRWKETEEELTVLNKKHKKYYEERIENYVNEVIKELKEGHLFYLDPIRIEFRLATYTDCLNIINRLNNIFPGTTWYHFKAHELCGIFQKLGCDCSYTRDGLYNGIKCDRTQLITCLEKQINFLL
jgi:hypothetical protein